MRNKTFGFINIFGLTAGTLCCIYILLYVTDQFSYDKHHADAKDIYRVVCHYDIKTQGILQDVSTTSAQTAPVMKKDLPEVAQYTRVIPFAGIDQHLLRYRDRTVYEKDPLYVDSTFFDVFSYKFLKGNRLSALRAPYTVVLTASTAEKLFGADDPMGQHFVMENAGDSTVTLTVTGVVDERLGKSHLHASMFLTMNSGNSGSFMKDLTSWTSNTYVSSYVKLRPGTDPAAVEKKLPVLVDRYAGDQVKKSGVDLQLRLQPVNAVHTTPGFMGIQLDTVVNPALLHTLWVVALLIQLIACINFMNLSTARASRRAKEVGVRKVIGARRADLVRQFMGESFLITLLSVAIALPLLMTAIPFFNWVTGASVQLSFIDIKLVLGFTGLVLMTAVVAGSYPAFYLSAFRAIRVIKGNFSSHISAGGVRRGLVIFQFVLSTVLILGIVVIYSQLNFIKRKDLGFEKDQKLLLSFYTQESMKNMWVFMNDLRGLSEIKCVSNASHHLGRPYYYNNSFFLRGQDETKWKMVNYIIPDQYFVRGGRASPGGCLGWRGWFLCLQLWLR